MPVVYLDSVFLLNAAMDYLLLRGTELLSGVPAGRQRCVLAALSQGDAYGYVLTQRVRQAVELSESTLYPVLRRLEREGCLSSYDQNYQGRNRRYYRITPQGRERYQAIRQQWIRFSRQIDHVLLEEESHEQRPISG